MATFSRQNRNKNLERHYSRMLTTFASEESREVSTGPTPGGDPERLRGLPVVRSGRPARINYTTEMPEWKGKAA